MHDELSASPTSEIVKYLQGLKEGTYAFAWTLDPHEAAAQLHFGRRFTATYGLLSEWVNDHNRQVDFNQMTEHLAGIVREETRIDRLAQQKPRYRAAIVYLRALESGSWSFPYVLNAPSASTMLSQISRAFPELRPQQEADAFQSIYDQTIAFGQHQIRQSGSVSIYKLIESWRQGLLRFAGS